MDKIFCHKCKKKMTEGLGWDFNSYGYWYCRDCWKPAGGWGGGRWGGGGNPKGCMDKVCKGIGRGEGECL